MRSIDGTLRPLLAAAVLCAAVLASSVAAAAGVAPNEATAAQKKQATDHFAAGKLAFESQNWERATLELRASLEVVDSPNARLVLARVLRDSGNLGEAWTEYGVVIETSTKLAATEARYAQTAGAATSERIELEPKLAFVSVSVAHPPANATLTVAGRAIAASDWTAPVVVPPGTVDVVLAGADGKELARQIVSALVGQRTAVSLEAQSPLPSPPPAEDPDDKDRPDEVHDQVVIVAPASGPGLRPYAYVAGGVGVAGLATFAIFGLMDQSTYHNLRSSCPGNACPPGKQGEVDSGRTQQVVANVGLVIGALGLATGATLFILSPRTTAAPAPPASASLVVGPGAVGVGGTF